MLPFEQTAKLPLGDRMKRYYEDVYRIKLPRRTNLIIRLDGKSFHTFTKNLDRPFDMEFIRLMSQVALELVKSLQGAKFGYTQSDEISILLTDYDDIKTEAAFDNNLQKIVSIASSTASWEFCRLWQNSTIRDKVIGRGVFDCRAFIIPEQEEVLNYFLWRQQDASRNSLNLLAQSLYSHKELQGRKSSELHDMCINKGYNWNNLPVGCKRGLAIKGGEILEPPIFTSQESFIREIFPC